MLFRNKQPLVACLFAMVWAGWAVWANIPHYYDIQAIRDQLAISMPNTIVQPARAGFPFAYMQYEYTPNGNFRIHNPTLSAVLPNVLFCAAGILGVWLLLLQIRRVTRTNATLLCLVVSPGLFLYVLFNGVHPDAVNYLYLTPLVVLLIILADEVWQKGYSRTTKCTEVPVANPLC